jgi:hypothetical protein
MRSTLSRWPVGPLRVRRFAEDPHCRIVAVQGPLLKITGSGQSNIYRRGTRLRRGFTVSGTGADADADADADEA